MSNENRRMNKSEKVEDDRPPPSVAPDKQQTAQLRWRLDPSVASEGSLAFAIPATGAESESEWLDLDACRDLVFWVDVRR
jgi:hypothetical protein